MTTIEHSYINELGFIRVEIMPQITGDLVIFRYHDINNHHFYSILHKCGKPTRDFKDWWSKHTSKKLPKNSHKIKQLVESYNFVTEHSVVQSLINVDGIKFNRVDYIFNDGTTYTTNRPLLSSKKNFDTTLDNKKNESESKLE